LTADILSLLQAAAGKYGLDPSLVVAVANQESGGNPNAVSPAGAQGVMQLMPATAQQFGVTDPFDPAQNIDAGVRYLAQLMNQFGDPQLALAAYNWGPGNVAKYGTSNWPAETANYVSSILTKVGSAVSSVFSPSAPDATGDSSGEQGSVDTGSLVLLVIAGGILFWGVSKWLG